MFLAGDPRNDLPPLALLRAAGTPLVARELANVDVQVAGADGLDGGPETHEGIGRPGRGVGLVGVLLAMGGHWMKGRVERKGVR